MNVPQARYTHHENGTRGIRLPDARTYERKFKLKAGTLTGITDDVASGEVPVMGDAAFGLWRDKSVDREPRVNKRLPGVPNTTGAELRYAVQVVDESLNKTFLVGDYAICIPMAAEPIKAGWLVHVEHKRGTLVERTIRRVEDCGHGRFRLTTHTTISRFFHQIHFPPTEPGESVNIIGKVIGKYCDIAFD